MQQAEQTAGRGEFERSRVEAVVETLAALHGQGESLAEVAHDARNMVTALGLYCDLLEEPDSLPFVNGQAVGTRLPVRGPRRRCVMQPCAVHRRESGW